MHEHLSNTYPTRTTPPPDASGGPPLQEAGRAGLSKTRLAIAFLVAATSDVVSFWTELVPPVQWVVDLVTALLLFTGGPSNPFSFLYLVHIALALGGTAGVRLGHAWGLRAWQPFPCGRWWWLRWLSGDTANKWPLRVWLCSSMRPRPPKRTSRRYVPIKRLEEAIAV